MSALRINSYHYCAAAACAYKKCLYTSSYVPAFVFDVCIYEPHTRQPCMAYILFVQCRETKVWDAKPTQYVCGMIGFWKT